MPAIHFHVRWPDGSEDQCYSPSTVVKEYFQVGERLSVDAFVERADTALEAASQRVEQKFGFFCSSAIDQSTVIKAKAQQFGNNPQDMVEIIRID